MKSTWMNESRRQTSDTVRGDGSMQASGSVQHRAAGSSRSGNFHFNASVNVMMDQEISESRFREKKMSLKAGYQFENHPRLIIKLYKKIIKIYL